MINNHWTCYGTEKSFVPNEDKFGFVYIITNTKNDKAYVGCKQYYIGKSKKQSKWQTYMGSSKYLNEDIKKIGKKYFTFEVIAEYKNKRSLRYYEMYYQVKWNVLTATVEGSDKPAFYNSYVGGKFYRPIESYKTGEDNFLYGKKLTEETKRKISKSSLGKKLTEETKRKLSEAQLGRKHTEETKRKMSEAQLGKKRTEETKRKMSKSLLGRKLTEETKRKMSKSRLGKIPWNKGKKYTHNEE